MDIFKQKGFIVNKQGKTRGYLAVADDYGSAIWDFVEDFNCIFGHKQKIKWIQLGWSEEVKSWMGVMYFGRKPSKTEMINAIESRYKINADEIMKMVDY